LFDYERLSEMVIPSQSAVVAMLYEEAAQVQQTERMIDYGIHLSRELSIRKRDQPRYWFEVMMHLLQWAARFKHPSFDAEAEVRILRIGIERNECKVRRDVAGARHYVEGIPFAALNGFMLGPRSTVSETEVRDLLKQRDLAVPIQRSRAPLR
jgi:hypothetical protein